MAKPSALPIFQRTFGSKPHKMSDADERTLHSDWGKSVKEAEGQNRNALAQAALKLAKRKWDAPLDDIAEHRGSWAPVFGRESFSPEYSGWWAMSLSVLFGDKWWDAVGKVWIAAHALAAIEPPKKILLNTLRGESQRTLTGGAAWQWGKAPFSQMPGPRFLWADPLNASTLIQRAIIHPCLGLASGRGAKITNWEHENFGLPLAVLLNKKAKKPASWGTVKLGQEAVEHLDWLPALPKADWVRYQWFEDGTRIVGLSRSRTGTRGTVPLSLSKGSVVTYFTAAKSKGQGNWSQCGSKLVGKKWVVESGDGKLEVKVPGEPTLEILWDWEGARVVIGETAPPKPAPPKPGEGGDLITRALSLIDQAIPGAPLEDESRTAAEVLRRTLRGERASALQGAKTLVKKLTKSQPAAPSQGQTEARIAQALTLIDQAIPGAPLEDQSRTAAEVLRRTLRGDQPLALQGAKTLVKKLS